MVAVSVLDWDIFSWLCKNHLRSSMVKMYDDLQLSLVNISDHPLICMVVYFRLSTKDVSFWGIIGGKQITPFISNNLRLCLVNHLRSSMNIHGWLFSIICERCFILRHNRSYYLRFSSVTIPHHTWSYMVTEKNEDNHRCSRIIFCLGLIIFWHF